MQVIEIYEPICRLKDDSVISLGLYNSYGEANDAAIMFASEELPEEKVKAYQIVKTYINKAAFNTNP